MKFSNREWLDANKTRNYPIKEGLGKTSSSGFIIPNDFIVDLRISGTFERTEVTPGTFENVDYFIHQIYPETVSILGTLQKQTVISIREIQRQSYNSGDPSTYNDIGLFRIPYGQLSTQKYSLDTSVGVTYRGEITIETPLDDIVVSLQEFVPDNTTLEARTLIPIPGTPKVTTIRKDGDAFSAFGNVNIGERDGIEITPVQSANGLRLDAVATKDCESITPGNECSDNNSFGCPQPTTMFLNQAKSDRNFNFKISGKSPINVSALPVLVPGGNPLNPNDYEVNSVVITYHGPITTEFLGGDPSDYNNYRYGFSCKHTAVGQQVPGLISTSESLLAKMSSIASRLGG